MVNSECLVANESFMAAMAIHVGEPRSIGLSFYASSAA
jgi:hypothetical protein